jgi:hypothetical protein
MESMFVNKWHLDKSRPCEDVDQSDFFNYTANAINNGSAALQPLDSKEDEK